MGVGAETEREPLSAGSQGGSRPGRRWLRVAGGVGGGLLLAGAVWVASREVPWQRLAEADPRLALAVAGGVLANVGLSGLLFWVVTRSFDASPVVPLGRMQALIAASALLNYLPLRPGLLGRAAFLKWRHRLSVRQSTLVLLLVLAISGATVVPVAVLMAWLPGFWSWVGSAAVLAALSVVLPAVARSVLGRAIWAGWLWVPVKAMDLLAAACRLQCAFWLVGASVSFEQALTASAAGLLVSLVGLTPNGLGLREWVIAGLSELLVPASGANALAASVLDRAVEVTVLVPLGLMGVFSLKREASRARGPASTSMWLA